MHLSETGDEMKTEISTEPLRNLPQLVDCESQLFPV